MGIFNTLMSWFSKNWADGQVFPAGKEFSYLGSYNLLVAQFRDEPMDWIPDLRLGFLADRSVELAWTGRFTNGRSITLRCYEDGAWTLSADTATGRPSTFFATCPALQNLLPEVCAREEKQTEVEDVEEVYPKDETPCYKSKSSYASLGSWMASGVMDR
jgi:hypothetical protein